MPFPTAPILDTALRPHEGPPPSADWVSKVDSDDGGMKIVSQKLAPDDWSASALWSAQFTRSQEVYATVDAFVTTGGLQELWSNVADGGSSAPSGYVFRFWHSGGGGSGELELDRADNGVFTRLIDTAKSLIAGDVLGGQNDNGVLYFVVNGGYEANSGDATYEEGKIGPRCRDDSSQLLRLSNFGGGGKPSVSPDMSEAEDASNRADSGGEKG